MEWGPVDPLRLVIEDNGVETLQDFMELDYEGTALMEYSVFSGDPDPTTGDRAETLTALTKPETNLLRISIAFAIARSTNPVDGSEPGKYNWYECDGDDFEAFRTGNSGYTATKTLPIGGTPVAPNTLESRAMWKRQREKMKETKDHVLFRRETSLPNSRKASSETRPIIMS